ncbi:hypothetical protein Taro_020724 [Colocasia esculenta]|uniref:Protein kinase domain-containing protein n=1 Tax=Colocasia esculenta TaxID=4460 RepID=A0A843UX43_COLES|nr:hypothetical protein [Colocasia esculenta]
MERHNYEQFHYNTMEPRAESLGPGSQKSVQVSSSSSNINAKPLEGNVLGGVRPVNYSIQTGEEFALEFMRERANSRKTSAQSASGDQGNAAGYMDLKGLLGVSHTESESGSDISLFAGGEKTWTKDVDKKNYLGTGNKGQGESSRGGPHASSADGSSHGIRHGSSGTSDSLSSKMKFLCSFGGKILPRPSDGKLRYVGGETRMIRISKDISWQEFVQKTSAIYNQARTIKYQLPGEDLDALVSVSCDEDLQNMMEECSVLESAEGSQKLRIFLFSSGDVDEMQFGLGSMEGDSEIQYMVAVNGMDLQSGKISSGHNNPSTSANDLDLLNLGSQGDTDANKLNVDSLRTDATSLVGATLPPFTAPLSTSIQASLSDDYGIQTHSYQDRRIHHEGIQQYVPSTVNNPHDGTNNLNSRISIPSLPPDYNYTSHYELFGETSVVMPVHQILPSKQGGVPEGLYGGLRVDKEIPSKDANLKVEGFVLQKPEGDQIRPSESELHAHLQHEGATLKQSPVEGLSYDTSSQEHKMSILSAKHKDHMETEVPEQRLSPLEPGTDNLIYESNDEGLYASGEGHISGFSNSEADTADFSYSEVSSRTFRVFHSERIPREPMDLVNRLSKSDDSIGSQFLIPSCAALAQQESISESVDPLHEGNLISQSEKSAHSGKPLYANVTTIEDGLLQFEKYKELADAITRTNQSDAVPAKESSETMSFSCHPVLTDSELLHRTRFDVEDGRGNLTGHAAHGQTEAMSEEQTLKVGKKLQKSELSHALSAAPDDTRTIPDDRIHLESDAGRHRESYISDSEKAKVKVHVTEPSTSEIESAGSTGVGNVTKKQENPAASLAELHWGDISMDSVYPKEVKVQAQPFAWPVSSAGGVAQPEPSAYDAPSQRKDILIDINDRFPRDLLSDLFSKARITEDSAIVRPMRKDDTGLSLNMHNPEPKRWSFFRNLAQDEFNRKDVSLIDQDHIPYPSPFTNVEDGGPTTYEFSHLNRDMVYNVSQIDFDEEIQQVSSGNANDTTTVAPVYIPSQAGDEGVQTENPLRTPLSEYEEAKLDISNIGGPAIDIPLGDLDLSNLQIIKNEDLEELRELGSGTFGTVYHGKWRGTDVAIKRIKKSCFTGRSSEQERLTWDFWREAEILSKLHHPNVVAFYGVVKDGPGGTLATVTEFMVNGSLRHVLLRKDRYLDRRKRLIIAMDAAIGMEYLHSKNIVHFDLKCDNLLVNLKDPQRPICKVGDFGLSKIKRNTLVSGGVRGTLPWMAPELLNGSSSKVSEKVDVFSFGIVMWEILTGEEPYANMHYGAIIGGIVSNTLRPTVPVTCDPEWRRLMEQCWAPDPVQRPSFTEIAGHLRAMSVALQSKPHNVK